MRPKLFTVGHSRHSIERFIDLLRAHGVEALVDVRSRPYSKWAPQYKKHALSRLISSVGFGYEFLGKELGGLLDSDGGDRRALYQSRREDPDFARAIGHVIELSRARCAALLCAEEDPTHCHRHLLITPALLDRGVEVMHIRGDGRVQSAAGDTTQLSLFS